MYISAQKHGGTINSFVISCSQSTLKNGTIIRAKQHYQFLSVGNFIFKAQQYSEADAKEYGIWLWKMIENGNNDVGQ